MQLTRPAILTAAIAILDEYGLADTTMRRIAKQLGVAPGALYWHFPNKQALLAGIADELLRPLLTHADEPADSQPQTSWDQGLHMAATSLHDCMLSVTDGADVIATALANPQLRQRVLAACAAPLAQHPTINVDDPLALEAAATIVDYVVGATIGEQSRLRLAQFATTTTPKDNKPNTPNTPTSDPAPTTPTMRVSDGVSIIIDGITTRL
ncbi:hypothetical protein CAQU_08255 [Corynebacterium aquilae DSM 44791]|uniref:HTH tetR-type domain-containing protein n=1 Tax=Corynebacterium aquilae DSM 44791 TaxID=1431546 RepID=A0A1L7CGV7_9CORY|nr:hypothetical protein CAQU_08255 [Corynebacterium aquilae DSM 44791]